MGSSSPICQRIAGSLAQGKIALLPSDGLYMALVSAQHCESLAKVVSLCGQAATSVSATVMAFVPGVSALDPWGLKLPPQASELAKDLWPGPLSFIQTAPAESTLRKLAGKQAIEVSCARQSFLAEVLLGLAQLGKDDVRPPLLLGLPAHRPGELPVSSGRWLPRALGQEAFTDLLERAPFVIDAGPTQTGCLPTALNADDASLTLVRQGPISQATLEEKLKSPLERQLFADHPEYKDLVLRIAEPPSKGLEPVQELDRYAWAIGVGPRPKNCPDERWIELYDEPNAFIAKYFDALAQASDAGAKVIYLRLPNKELNGRLGLSSL